MHQNKIAISGYYGFGNTGDEAVLMAMLESLYEENTNLDITVISGNPSKTQKNFGIKAIPRLHIPSVIKTLSESDLLISGGGSLLQDVTSNRSIYYYLGIMQMAIWLNTKVFLYAQGIGPIGSNQAKRAVKNVLNKVNGITVRDHASYELLTNLGIQTPIEVTADAVLSMHPVDRGIGRLLLKKQGIDGIGPWIGMCVRDWENSTSFYKEVANAADLLQAEYNCDVVFIPMQCPQDVLVAKKIKKFMTNEAYILEEAYTATEVMSIIGCMDIIIGVRLHALILGAIMNVRLVGISYDPKIDSFLDSIGGSLCGDIKTVKAEDILRSVRAEMNTTNRKKSKQSLQQLQKEARRTSRMAFSLIQKGT